MFVKVSPGNFCSMGVDVLKNLLTIGRKDNPWIGRRVLVLSSRRTRQRRGKWSSYEPLEDNLRQSLVLRRACGRAIWQINCPHTLQPPPPLHLWVTALRRSVMFLVSDIFGPTGFQIQAGMGTDDEGHFGQRYTSYRGTPGSPGAGAVECFSTLQSR